MVVNCVFVCNGHRCPGKRAEPRKPDGLSDKAFGARLLREHHIRCHNVRIKSVRAGKCLHHTGKNADQW